MEELPVVALQHPWLLAGTLFFSLLIWLEIGRAVGKWRSKKQAGSGANLLEAAVFTLLGLLLALSFSTATTRLETRRSLIVQEANAVRAAHLRVDMLPRHYRAPMDDAFARYARSRAEAYRTPYDTAKFNAAVAQSEAIQREIWAMAVEGGRSPDAPSANFLLLPAVNAMIDMTTTRTAALEMHTPAAVFLVLWLNALAAALVAGHAMSGSDRDWFSILIFVTVATSVLYVLIALEYPRLGLIGINRFDAILIRSAV